MSILNTPVNFAIRKITARGMRKYRTYPKSKTAVLLIDAQRGLLAGESDLVESYKKLVDFAKMKGFTVVHSQFDHAAKPTFPTEAHSSIISAIGKADGHEIPAMLAPKGDDVVMEARATLSAMVGPKLTETLRAKGIEHVVLAGPLPLTTLDSTMRDAVQQDFHVTVIDSLVTGRGEPAVEVELKYTMPRYAHEVMSLKSFIKYAERSSS